MIRITLIAGARPNFIKIAPILNAISDANEFEKIISYRLVHTGQHYDMDMSGSFFDQLQIPAPHNNLKCGGGSQSEQTANIMIAFEKELIAYPADLVLVVGDVNSTMACAIVAQKLYTKVAHVEAGIRSGDWSMPEEINRLITDSITNYFFTTTQTANKILIDSGVKKEDIYFVGNTMIDTLLKHKPNFIKPKIWNDLNLKAKSYCVITLHRPANVDEEIKLKNLINEIILNSQNMPLLFPMHPRTKAIFQRLNITHPRLQILSPLSYLEFNYLVEHSKVVITDSGGITEETTVMGVPCMTLRDNTERPETITEGTNELIGTDPKGIAPAFNKLLSNKWKTGKVPELWDGKSAKRIVNKILKIYNN